MIDYEEIYSRIMDIITFRYLIHLVVSKNLEICLVDFVTIYLYGSLDSNIYMKIPEGFKIPETSCSNQKVIFNQIIKIVIWVKVIMTRGIIA